MPPPIRKSQEGKHKLYSLLTVRPHSPKTTYTPKWLHSKMIPFRPTNFKKIILYNFNVLIERSGYQSFHISKYPYLRVPCVIHKLQEGKKLLKLHTYILHNITLRKWKKNCHLCINNWFLFYYLLNSGYVLVAFAFYCIFLFKYFIVVLWIHLFMRSIFIITRAEPREDNGHKGKKLGATLRSL